jgi:RNA polymerase sigma-70 factor (ECF subfamily)
MRDSALAAEYEHRLSTEDERLLVDRARVDVDAFDELYRRYHRRIFGYLRTYAESPEDAADLTQHVFLRALEALPGYEQKGVPFSAWLFRIARNAATDAYRRRRQTLPWEHIPEAMHPLSSDRPEVAAERREALNELRVLVSRLDPRKQELLALRFAAGLTPAEIAAVVAKSEAAVRKQLYRTIRALQEDYHGL